MFLLLAGAAALTHHSDACRNLLRWLRYLLAAELVLVVLMAGVGAVYEQVGRARERRLYQPPGKLVDIGGYRLHLYCTGEGGPTVVLDFGLDGSYLDWYSVQPEVARFTRVCSYDRGGYGWSDPSPKPRTASVMAEELHALLAQAGEKPPYILVGHSLGSFDVLMYAHLYREQIAGVVLVDGAHPTELLPFYWHKRLWIRLMQWTAPLGLPRWRSWCGQGPEEIAPIKMALGCRSRVYQMQYETWSAFPESAAQVGALGGLGDLPLVVISRDPNRQAREPDDRVVPAKELRWQKLQERLARLSTNSTHLMAQGSGHSVPRQRPDVVVEGIRRVVEETRKPAPGK